jgi:lysosomal-associated membrane protein 1/2
MIANKLISIDFSLENVCEADAEKDSNLIPIIVGACLATLVIIVLVTYLIGRRRSRNGYQSV